MSVNLRWEQCCATEGCTKPAHHGSLCAACFLAATPARRRVEMMMSRDTGDAEATEDFVSADGAQWLADLWAA